MNHPDRRFPLNRGFLAAGLGLLALAAATDNAFVRNVVGTVAAWHGAQATPLHRSHLAPLFAECGTPKHARYSAWYPANGAPKFNVVSYQAPMPALPETAGRIPMPQNDTAANAAPRDAGATLYTLVGPQAAPRAASGKTPPAGYLFTHRINPRLAANTAKWADGVYVTTRPAGAPRHRGASWFSGI